jgi:hypothetical protein
MAGSLRRHPQIGRLERTLLESELFEMEIPRPEGEAASIHEPANLRV